MTPDAHFKICLGRQEEAGGLECGLGRAHAGNQLTLPAVCWDVGHDNMAFGLEYGGWPTFWEGAMATAEFCSGYMAPDAQRWLGLASPTPSSVSPHPLPCGPSAMPWRLGSHSSASTSLLSSVWVSAKSCLAPGFATQSPGPGHHSSVSPQASPHHLTVWGTLPSHPWPGPCPQAYCALQGLVAPPLSGDNQECLQVFPLRTLLGGRAALKKTALSWKANEQGYGTGALSACRASSQGLTRSGSSRPPPGL